jgi:hypothetical protein
MGGSIPETTNLPKPMRVKEEGHSCNRTAARAKEKEIKT